MKKKIFKIVSAATLTLFAVSCAKNTAPAADASKAPLAPVSTGSTSSYVEGVAGGIMVSTLQLEAEVVAVDQEKREAVLRGPEGNEVTVKVGKNAVNFYQVAVGDRVDVAMQRELKVFVADAPQTEEDGTVAIGAGAQEGEAPAGVVVASSRITGKIDEMDLEKRTAKIVFEDGTSAVFEVRPDVDMTKYSVGQEVVFLITEMLALEVRKL